MLLHFSPDPELIRRAQNAIVYFMETQNYNSLLWTFANLIYAEWSNDNFEQAEQIGYEALNYISSNPQIKVPNLRNYCFILLWLARLDLSNGRINRARQRIKKAVPSFRVLGGSLAFDYTHILDFLAVLFTREGDMMVAVKLFGAVDEMYHRYKPSLTPRQRSEHKDALDTARCALGEDAFTAAWEAGLAKTLEQAVAMALTGKED